MGRCSTDQISLLFPHLSLASASSRCSTVFLIQHCQGLLLFFFSSHVLVITIFSRFSIDQIALPSCRHSHSSLAPAFSTPHGLRLDICQKKLRDRKFWGKNITLKNVQRTNNFALFSENNTPAGKNSVTTGRDGHNKHQLHMGSGPFISCQTNFFDVKKYAPPI